MISEPKVFNRKVSEKIVFLAEILFPLSMLVEIVKLNSPILLLNNAPKS